MIFVKMKGHLNCSKKLRGVIVKDISALNEYEYVSGERRRKAKQEDGEENYHAKMMTE